MYATIRHDAADSAAIDDIARASRALAARLGAVPGFVACLLVAADGGGWAMVCICEDRASLAAADELVAGWPPVEHPAPRADPSRRITGEVIGQRGL